MDAAEIAQLQTEEVEVLVSIFEGDPAFCPVSASQPPFHFQYKFGEDGSGKSALMDVRWGERYPEAVPDVSFEAFYNRHIPADVKQRLVDSVREQAEGMVGMSMTYTLIEYLKENIEELLKELPEELADVSEAIKTVSLEEKDGEKGKAKKEQLTKSQKRRMWNRGGLESEDRPRGWNWVDIVKHLSQTSSKEA